MGEDKKKEVKPSPIPNQPGQQGGRNHRWTKRGSSGSGQTTFKGKTKEIEEDIFDIGGTHDAALFSSSLKNISDHIQLKLLSDVSVSVRNMTLLDIDIPPTPKPTVNAAGNQVPVTDVDFYLWKCEHTKAQDRQDKYDEGMKTAYTIMFHQFSPALKTELEGTDKFTSIRASQDVLSLLGLIKGLVLTLKHKE
jgi:hypothetical protein